MSNGPQEIDRFDSAILRALSEDGRMSVTELARRIGLTKTPTQARVKRLEETGVIAGYRAVLNPIQECHMMAAGFDYLMKVRTSDIGDYRRVLGERISTLPHVASTSTYVAMEAVKETGL
ncbi:MAG: proline dehydrogenase transcriptional activator [Rhodobacterales bacterium 32-67-9]|nr:MAG: proline dehydrogenase transcriptional activator [Rhodobacterales bacterium 32-67-9]